MSKLALLLASFFCLSGCSISQKKSQKLYTKASHNVYDIAIVPGLPHKSENWDRILKARIYWAKYLYDKGIVKNIMFSGGSVYTPYYEGKIMALFAEEIGLPPDVIYSEIKAEHSTENIYYGYKKAKLLGFQNVALVTDPFQTKMLKSFIRKKIEAPIALIPFVYDSLSVLEPTMINPTINDSLAFNPDFVSILERESSRKRFKGTRGGNINESFYEN